MPYRRLPNTDQARIRALSMAIKKEGSFTRTSSVILPKHIYEAKNFLLKFESANNYYRQCLENQVKSNKKYQSYFKTAKLYISHFVQVLNLSIIRAEIKVEYKDLYGLDQDTNSLPDLSTETHVLEWGEKIIKGEEERLKLGGVPIYNPTIARVRVHYNIFKEAYHTQKNLQHITAKSLDTVASMREQADNLILDIWNQIEMNFESFAGEDKLNKCREYGVVYYYRTGEKKPN